MYQDNPPAGQVQEPGEAVVSLVDAPAVTTDESTPADSAEPREPVHAFRDELARAMQAAAERERLRIEAEVDADATAHIEKVRTRASAEATELKRLAEDDVTGIRGWAKSEIERIRGEADSQIDERRDRLEQHLVHHSTIIDGEIDRVSEAVEGYRRELDAFFASMAAERDPSQIARMADTVPGPPDFELIRSIARAEAVDRLSELEASAETPAASEPGADEQPAAGGPSADDQPAAAGPSADDQPAAAGAPASVASEVSEQVAASAAEPVAIATEDQPSAATVPAPAESTAEAEAPAVAMASAESAGDASDAEPELVPVMDPVLAEKPADEDAGTPVAVEMAVTAGEPAAAEAAPEAESPEPVGAASAPDSNPAARFIRSLASWGSSIDHGSNDESK